MDSSAPAALEMGLLPITQLNGKAGAQYRNPQDQELRLDFLTSMTRAGVPVAMPGLNLAGGERDGAHGRSRGRRRY
jgi:hypothetical protein